MPALIKEDDRSARFQLPSLYCPTGCFEGLEKPCDAWALLSSGAGGGDGAGELLPILLEPPPPPRTRKYSQCPQRSLRALLRSHKPTFRPSNGMASPRLFLLPFVFCSRRVLWVPPPGGLRPDLPRGDRVPGPALLPGTRGHSPSCGERPAAGSCHRPPRPCPLPLLAGA